MVKYARGWTRFLHFLQTIPLPPLPLAACSSPSTYYKRRVGKPVRTNVDVALHRRAADPSISRLRAFAVHYRTSPKDAPTPSIAVFYLHIPVSCPYLGVLVELVCDSGISRHPPTSGATTCGAHLAPPRHTHPAPILYYRLSGIFAAAVPLPRFLLYARL